MQRFLRGFSLPNRLAPETPAAITAPTEGLKTLPPVEPQPPAALPQAETPAWLGAQAPTAEAAPQVETDETIPEWLREITAATEAEAAAGSAAQVQPSEPPAAKSAQAGIVQAEPSSEIMPGPTVSEPVRPEPSIPAAELGISAQAKEKPEGEPVTSLAQARALWTSGNRPGAIDLYEKALQSGPRFTADVIADFEQFVKEPDAPMPAHRLLGDAYAMVGRFKEALEQYRIVMGK